MMMRKQEAEEAKEAEGGTKRDRHVMFVSHTPGDLLAKNLQKAEDKFVENCSAECPLQQESLAEGGLWTP